MGDGNNYPGGYSGDPTSSYSDNLRWAETLERQKQDEARRKNEEAEAQRKRDDEYRKQSQ